MSDSSILKLENIVREFRDGNRVLRAVDGVSIALGRKETVGIVGESGSGKSTLARIAVGIDGPTSGKIYVDGRDVTAMSRSERFRQLRRAQMVFQDPYSSLNPSLTVGRQIAEVLLANGVKKTEEIRERIGELFEQVGLRRAQMDQYPHEFSGGQRQRIAIARALAPRPSIVVADEPVSALDVSVQAQILNLLADLQEKNSLSYLFIAHDIAVVAHISQIVVVMYKGRVLEHGRVGEIIGNPMHPYTRSLLDAIPRMGRRRKGEVAGIPVLAQPLPGDKLCQVTSTHWVLTSDS